MSWRRKRRKNVWRKKRRKCHGEGKVEKCHGEGKIGAGWDRWTVIKGSIRGARGKKVTHSLLEILNFAKKKSFGTWFSKGQYCMVLGGGTGWALVILGQHRGEPIYAFN